MPRDTTEMPRTIRASDKGAQRTWQKTHDSAVKTYGEGEAAHRVAYASLKHSYKKQGGVWVKKDHKGPSDPQAAQGYRDKPKATAGGRVARTEEEAREQSKIAAKEYRKFRERTDGGKKTRSKSRAAGKKRATTTGNAASATSKSRGAAAKPAASKQGRAGRQQKRAA